jgi:cell division protein FtsI (penicillin-binding protein 3)
MKSTFIKGSRSRVLALAILLIAAIFIGRLFYLQVVQHDYYVALAAEEQQSRFVIPANRGTIYAKSGSTPVELVMNQTVYTVFADPQTVQNKEEIVKSLKEIAAGEKGESLSNIGDQAHKTTG